MVKVIENLPEMAEIKWANLFFVVLLSLGVCYSSQRELAPVKEESYKQDNNNNINGEEKWGIGGAIGGGINIGGDDNGCHGNPGINIGGDARAGISLPGINIGGDVNGRVSGTGSISGGISGDISLGGGGAPPCSSCNSGGAYGETDQSLDLGSNALNNNNATINDANSIAAKQENNEAHENEGEVAEAVAPSYGWPAQDRI